MHLGVDGGYNLSSVAASGSIYACVFPHRLSNTTLRYRISVPSFEVRTGGLLPRAYIHLIRFDVVLGIHTLSELNRGYRCSDFDTIRRDKNRQ